MLGFFDAKAIDSVLTEEMINQHESEDLNSKDKKLEAIPIMTAMQCSG